MITFYQLSSGNGLLPIQVTVITVVIVVTMIKWLRIGQTTSRYTHQHWKSLQCRGQLKIQLKNFTKREKIYMYTDDVWAIKRYQNYKIPYACYVYIIQIENLTLMGIIHHTNLILIYVRHICTADILNRAFFILHRHMVYLMTRNLAYLER